jgi:hypothetical protein
LSPDSTGCSPQRIGEWVEISAHSNPRICYIATGFRSLP